MHNPVATEARAADPRREAQRLIQSADSNVQALIRLFEVPGLPGETARERTDWILKITASDLPGMQMGLFPPEDSGFKPELGDLRFYFNPRYWANLLGRRPRATKQVGHFLTAVGLRLNRWPDRAKLRLIIGHEKLGDHLFLNFLWQYLLCTEADLRRFLAAVELDRLGYAEERDRALRQILGASDEALPDPRRIGNSLPDLRLSVKGWRFGTDLKTGALRARAAAAAWLRRELYDPARTRARLPSPARFRR
jgi:hypothetical protein